jgi:hypothetical protein
LKPATLGKTKALIKPLIIFVFFQEFDNVKHIFIFISFAAVILLFGCKRASESVPAGAYAYTCYDSSGVALVDGWLLLVITDSSKVTGEWLLDPIGDPQNVGPQTGKGKLRGGIDGEKIWIELNPEFNNDNLQLHGILLQGRLEGQWAWIRYDGLGNQGTFRAIKK